MGADMPQELPLSLLDARLGYEYKDSELRLMALTHPSFYNKADSQAHYERLEFLGDAVLQLVVTEFLYRQLPQATEGLMTQLRARVVSRTSLALVARRLELNSFILMGKGEELSGGRERESTLSNTFEALLGAIMLDSNFEVAKKVTLALLEESLLEVSQNPREMNPKGELQTLLQKIYPESPVYKTEENEDKSLSRFRSEVLWRGFCVGKGMGESKQRAEVQAAEQALAGKLWEGKSWEKN